jgi:hypothetical protein
VDTARERVQANVAPSSAGDRSWELYGNSFCPCGWRLVTYTNRRRKNGATWYFYACSRRRHDNTECSHARYHRAADLEERVRRFVVSLVEEPGVIGEQIRLHADRQPEGHIRTLLKHEGSLKETRERYLEQYAGG